MVRYNDNQYFNLNQMTRVIALHGAVACGKTTLLNHLKQALPYTYVIPEYIDALPDASDKLNQYLNARISAFAFQDYILDYFESMANKLKDSTYDYILVERTPIEGIQFFANLDLINERMTEQQYNALLQRAQSMTFYPNPSLAKSITINTDLMEPYQVLHLVLSMLSDFDFDVIKLRASFTTIKQRIKQRGRQCEIEHYNDDYLKALIASYD